MMMMMMMMQIAGYGEKLMSEIIFEESLKKYNAHVMP